MILNNYKKGERITEPDANRQLLRDDTTTAMYIFNGGLISGLEEVELEWHEDKSGKEIFGMDLETLSLNEIANQVKFKRNYKGIIMLFIQGPLYTHVYEYGNHGEYWEYLGEYMGYW